MSRDCRFLSLTSCFVSFNMINKVMGRNGEDGYGKAVTKKGAK